MILFKPEHKPMILTGQKTQTRRLGNKRWNVGAIHKSYTRPAFARPPGKPFASVRILRVWEEQLKSISDEDAAAEGYPDRFQYLYAFYRIHGLDDVDERRAALEVLVWCVEFELLNETA